MAWITWEDLWGEDASKKEVIEGEGPHLIVAKDGLKAYCCGHPAGCEFCAREAYASQNKDMPQKH